MTLDPQTVDEIPLEPDIHVAHRRRGMFFLGLAVGGVGFALSLQMGVNSNFVRDVMGLSGQQQGMLEAWRECCGITGLLILALLAGLAEPLVAACVLALTAVGLAWYTFVSDYF